MSLKLLKSVTFLGCRQGNMAIEMAVIAPVLVLLMVGIADYGAGIYSKMQVQHAVQAGADFAMRNGFSANAISTAVANATPLPGLSVTPAPTQSCGCPNGTTVITATCGTACAAGGNAGVYVTISATATHTTLLPYPGMPEGFAFSAVSTVRIQ
jgi:Flp pilus assembly protein TadG